MNKPKAAATQAPAAKGWLQKATPSSQQPKADVCTGQQADEDMADQGAMDSDGGDGSSSGGDDDDDWEAESSAEDEADAPGRSKSFKAPHGRVAPARGSVGRAGLSRGRGRGISLTHTVRAQPASLSQVPGKLKTAEDCEKEAAEKGEREKENPKTANGFKVGTITLLTPSTRFTCD